MDLKTNSASTKDWVRVTQNMSISAYDPRQQQVGTAVQSKPSKAPEVPRSDPRSPLPSRG